MRESTLTVEPTKGPPDVVRLKETGSLADLLADLADVAYFQVDRNRRIVAASPALAELTGRSQSELIGSLCLTVMRCRECLEGCPVREDEELRGARVTLHRAEKEPVEVLHSGRVLRDENGDFVGFLEVVQPVEDAGGTERALNGENGRDDDRLMLGLTDEERVEARRIRQALQKTRYRRAQAAELLGISRTTLWRKMKLYRML